MIWLKQNLLKIVAIACLAGISWIIYYQQIYFPQKLETCLKIATTFEGFRHTPIDTYEITTADVSLLMKNVIACLAD